MKTYSEIVGLLLILFVVVYNKSLAIESSRGHHFLSTDRDDLRKLRPQVIVYNRVVIVLFGLMLIGLLLQDIISTLVSPTQDSGVGSFSWTLFAFLIVWTGTAIGGVIFFLRRRATSLEDTERKPSDEG